MPYRHATGGNWVAQNRVCDDVMTSARTLIEALGTDFAGLVEYDETARWSDIDATSESLFNFVYGANLAEAVGLARLRVPRSHRAIVIAHSPPDAHRQPSGDVFFNTPAIPETIRITASEIDRCVELRLRIDALVVPPARAVLPWPDSLVEAVARTGGSFTQAASSHELADAIEDLGLRRP